MNFNPGISGLPGYENFHKASRLLNEQLSDLIKQHSLARDKWSEQMMKDFIVQLLLSGDVFRLCTVNTEAEQVCYHPYEQVDRLQHRVKLLEGILVKAKQLGWTAEVTAEADRILYPYLPQ